MTSPPEILLSVCICTFNGAGRIGAVLAALGAQTSTSSDWEVLVIDNASTDGTAAVVEIEFQQRLPGRGRLVREEQPGLMHARKRATREALGSVLLFVDDDNLPAPDYVERALEVMARCPQAGVVGGRVEPEWLGQPTPLGLAVANFALALCDRGDQPFAYEEVTGGPAGAGMIVRRALLQKIFDEVALAERVTGRSGSSLMSGEDTAIVIRAHQLGYECRYEPTLHMKHRIPAARTARDYLLRLYEGIGRGQASLRPLFDAKARRAPLALLIALKDGGRWLVGQLSGPSTTVRTDYGALAQDVHLLHQRQVYGRFRQGLREALR
jgi:glycosyltransferase involved in cell wall biosynthesis